MGMLRLGGRAQADEFPTDLSPMEVDRLVDELSEAYLGIDGDLFRKMVRQGETLPDHPMVGHLLLLVSGSPDPCAHGQPSRRAV